MLPGHGYAYVGAPRLCPNPGRLSLGDEVAEAEVTRCAVPELRRDLPRHGPERDGDALDLQRGRISFTTHVGWRVA